VGSATEDCFEPLAAHLERPAVQIAIAGRTSVRPRIVRESPTAAPPLSLATAFLLYSVVHDRGCHTQTLPRRRRAKRAMADLNAIFTFGPHQPAGRLGASRPCWVIVIAITLPIEASGRFGPEAQEAPASPEAISPVSGPRP
jgi:hypothetical protein